MDNGEKFKVDIVKVRTYIEENLRKTSISGLPYIDLHDNRRSILAKQNNVVFGRRGSGKSTLLGELIKGKVDFIEINLENYKNISFPNIIIKVVEEIYISIKKSINKQFSFHFLKKAKILKEFKHIIKELSIIYEQDDSFYANLEEKRLDQTKSEAQLEISSKNFSSTAGVSKTGVTEQRTTREMQFMKLDRMKKNLINYQKVLKEACEFRYSNAPLYIILDDFYFIPIDDQPYLADILHVLTKGINIYKKIASVKHRSRFYIKDQRTFQGIEIGHDAIEIDLDYSLEDMDMLKKFYSQLLIEIFRASHTNISENDLFGGAGFKQLCIASGGVTRDFLMLLSKCLNELIVNPGIREFKHKVQLSYHTLLAA